MGNAFNLTLNWYYSLSQQTKHTRDITSIVLTPGNELDYDDIDTWFNMKGLTSLWGDLLAKIRALNE